MRGRKPKPTILAALHGKPSHTAKDARINEPIPVTGSLDDPPDWLNPAQQAGWRYAMTHCPPGMLAHIDRGVLTSFNATLFDSAGKQMKSWPLPGIPSRTRISADSKLVAQTSFVTGSSYGTVGFSTQTTISQVNGVDYGNLEDFTFLVDGQKVTAADRNFWGVTFASDDNTFYATAASNNRTWLVRSYGLSAGTGQCGARWARIAAYQE